MKNLRALKINLNCIKNALNNFYKDIYVTLSLSNLLEEISRHRPSQMKQFVQGQTRLKWNLSISIYSLESKKAVGLYLSQFKYFDRIIELLLEKITMFAIIWLPISNTYDFNWFYGVLRFQQGIAHQDKTFWTELNY